MCGGEGLDEHGVDKLWLLMSTAMLDLDHMGVCRPDVGLVNGSLLALGVHVLQRYSSWFWLNHVLC